MSCLRDKNNLFVTLFFIIDNSLCWYRQIHTNTQSQIFPREHLLYEVDRLFKDKKFHEPFVPSAVYFPYQTHLFCVTRSLNKFSIVTRFTPTFLINISSIFNVTSANCAANRRGKSFSSLRRVCCFFCSFFGENWVKF